MFVYSINKRTEYGAVKVFISFSAKKLDFCANLHTSFETDWFSAALANVRTPI
jgi:hypothetical protein